MQHIKDTSLFFIKKNSYNNFSKIVKNYGLFFASTCESLIINSSGFEYSVTTSQTAFSELKILLSCFEMQIIGLSNAFAQPNPIPKPIA